MASDERPRTRQELYDRIRASSKDEVILEEMVRLGFWPARGESSGRPRRRDAPPQRARSGSCVRWPPSRRGLGNLEALKRELRKRRLEESKRKQQETKERRERERLAKAAAWKERKAPRGALPRPGRVRRV